MFKFLAVVVGAIFVLVVAAVLIPCLSNAKDAGHEASAVAMTRTLATAEIEYDSAHGHYANMKALAGTENCATFRGAGPCLIDSVVANSSPANPRNDYYFIAQLGPSPGTFVVASLPVKLPHKSFCATEDGVIHSGSGIPSYVSCKSLPAFGS